MQIRQIESSFVWLHRILDILLPFGLLYLITVIHDVPWHDRYLATGLISGLALAFFNQARGVYIRWRGRSLFAGYIKVLQAWAITWMFLIMLAFMLKASAGFSRTVFITWAIAVPLGLFSYRFILRLVISRLRSIGWNTKKIVIIGAGNLGQHIAESLLESRILGLEPVGFFDDDPAKTGTMINNLPVIGSINELLADKQSGTKYDQVYITLPLCADERIKQVLNTLADSTMIVKFVPDFFSFDLLHSKLSEIGGIPVLSVYDSPLNSTANATLKRLEDIVLSSVIITMISPLLCFLAVGVKLSSPGPVFFKQVRVGWNGKNFNMLKFRSMPVDVEKEGAQWGGSKNKTVTKFGAFIRKTSLDELPQFLNVLRGEMSIVGPRPERDIFVEQFRNEIPRYMQKHLVKAGITGWAQVNGWRGDTDLSKRIEYDLYYIDNWTIWLDVKIIFMTFYKGFINEHAY